MTYTWQNYKEPFSLIGVFKYKKLECTYNVFIKLEKKDDWKREACTCSGVMAALYS